MERLSEDAGASSCADVSHKIVSEFNRGNLAWTNEDALESKGAWRPGRDVQEISGRPNNKSESN